MELEAYKHVCYPCKKLPNDQYHHDMHLSLLVWKPLLLVENIMLAHSSYRFQFQIFACLFFHQAFENCISLSFRQADKLEVAFPGVTFSHVAFTYTDLGYLGFLYCL